ncbi:MAG: hypothetical protein JW801_03760 [Bacteroidales bacterium]|nr:hypothetical protein [Bacteroidales bacterium]
MTISTRSLKRSALLLTAIIPVFILPVLNMNFVIYRIFSGVLVAATLISLWKSRELFSSTLFFTLVHVCIPLNNT